MKKYIYSLIILILCVFSQADAARYYVKPDGNNSANGTSWATAWAHPNRGLSTMVSGDTMEIAPNSVPYDTVYIDPPNAATNWTVYACSSFVTDPDAGRSNTILSAGYPATAGWTSMGGGVWQYNALVSPRWNTVQDYNVIVTQAGQQSLGGKSTLCGSGGYAAYCSYSAWCTSAGMHWYDVANDRLYFRAFGDVDPNTVSIRISISPLFYAGATNEGAVKIIGLTLQEAQRGPVWIGNDGMSGSADAPDSIWILHCNVKYGGDCGPANNSGLVYGGFNSGAPPSTSNAFSNFIQVRACSLRYCKTPGTDYDGGGAVDTYVFSQSIMDSNYVDNCKAGGFMLKYGGGASAASAFANVIAFNKVVGGRAGVWAGARQDSLSIYGNIFTGQTYMGISIHSTISNVSYKGRLKILNNTFVFSPSSSGYNIIIAPTAESGTGLNEVRYNLAYQSTGNTIGFIVMGGEAPAQNPSTETHWRVDNNLWYRTSGSFSCSFCNNSGCSGNSFSTWQSCGGFDLQSSTTTNPNFNDINAGDYSRPSSSAEMNATYGGKTWTRFGAWQPAGSGCTVDFPVLSSPLNGSANLANPVVFDWADVAATTSYTLQVATDPSFTNIILAPSPSVSTYTSSVFLDGVTYYWRVRATTACGISPWSPYRIFNMACVSTPSVSLSTPAASATSQELSLTLDWADVTSINYQVQLSTSAAFTTTLYDQTLTASQLAVSSLNYATTYHWRVRAQNACGWGGWSARSFTTKVAPTSGSTTLTSYVTATGDDATYEANTFSSTDRLSFGNAGPARCSTYTIHNIVLTQGVPCQSAYLSFTSRANSSGTTCTVRIRGELTGNSATLTSGSMAARTYTTAYVDWTIPAWTTDVVYQSPDIKSIVDEITTLTGVTRIGFKVSDIGSTYEAFRTAYSYDISTTKTALLTVNYPAANTAPTVPVLVSPSYSSSANTLLPTLTLTNSTDAQGDTKTYLFEIASDTLFSNIIQQSAFVTEGTTTTSWTVTNTSLKNGLNYFWRARSYDGTLYSNWAAPNKFVIATTRLVDINQSWRNSTNGIVNTANGFLTGDVVRLTSNIITPDNWGIIINLKGIILQGDGYTVQCNNITVPAITNPGFESGSGTSATGWDFTNAPNAQRLAGQYDEIAEYSNPSTLMSGSYSLRFQVPCPTQVVTSSSTYTLDANRNWAICAVYYNQIQNPTIDPATDSVRVTIGFVDTNGDTLFSSEYLRGMMYRGPEPIVAHFKTTSAITGKIFFRLRNAQNITSTNSFIWIDDVKIIPFRPFSIGVAIDTTELKQLAQGAVRAYDAAGDTMAVLTGSNRMFSGLPATANTGDSTQIHNVVLRNNSSGGYGAYGLFYGYSADFIELHNSDVYTIGPNAFNIVSGSAVYNKVYNNILKLEVPYCDARESVPTSNIDFTGGKGPGPRGSIIYGNTFSGSIWCDINIQNRCDINIDGIDDYPVPVIRKNTFYRKTKITNGFVVDFTGTGGMIFDSNYVYGSDTLHGSGVHVQYQSPTCEQWVVIRDNIIKVSPDTVNQEYPYGTLAYGIQLEEAPRCSVYNNYVFSITDHIKDPSCSSIRINDGGIPCVQRIFGNQFIALSNNEANSPASCFQFGSPEAWDYDPDDGKVMEFYYNEFISNSAWIRALPKMRNWQPNNNVFTISDSLALMSWFTPLSSSTVDVGDPIDIRFLNNRYGSGAAKTAFKNSYIRADIGSSSAEAGSQYFYSHQLAVNIASTNTGLFLPAIEVLAYRNNMEFQDSDITDVYGKVYLLINEYEDAPLTSTYNASTDRKNYNPYTIIARTINQVLADTIVMTVDTFTTVNMNLDFNQYPTTSSPPVIDIVKPNSGKILPPLFNADTLAEINVLDDFGVKSLTVYLRGEEIEKNIYSVTNGVGSRPISQNFIIPYNTQYEDTLVQYLVVYAEDDSSDISIDSIPVSIPIATNITVTFSGKYIKDTWVDVNLPTLTREDVVSWRTTANGSRGWVYFDINKLKGDSLPSNVDIVSAYIDGYCDSKTGTGTIGIHDVFKNGAMDNVITYDRYNTSTASEWGTPGGNNTGDFPSCNYNTGDGTGCDRTLSSLFTLSPTLNAYNRWNLPDSTIQFLFDDSKPNNGWLFVATSTLNATVQTLEGVHAPIGSITYQVPRPAPVVTEFAPVLAPVGNKSITENQLLSFTLSASDQNLTTPFIFIAEQTKPSGVVMTDNANGTSLFTWTPTYRQAGVYNVLFIATDGQLTDSETIQITVLEAGDQRPQLLFVVPQSVNENSLLTFVIGGWEPDSNSFVMTATGLPSGASFVDNADSTGTFTWTPNFVQSGVYNVSFIMTETSGGILADTDVCAITVINVNRAPVLASIGNKSVNEGSLLTFSISATDADAQTLTFSTVNFPSGATLNNISNGNAQINWSPSFAQSGVYSTIFIVSDGAAADSESITITVADVSGITSITVNGTTNVEDAYLRPSQPNANYGTYTGGTHGMYIFANATVGKGIVRFKNIATLLPVNAIITNTYIKVNVWQFTRTGTLNANRVFQPWVEGASNGGTTAGVSYNHFDISGTKLWTTAGANSASDAGVDNLTGTVGTHFDRTATAAGSVSITGLGFFNISLPTGLVQGWRDGSIANNGVLLSTPNGDFAIYQSEFTTTTLRPELIIEYTTVVNQPTKGRKHPLRGIGTGVVK